MWRQGGFFYSVKIIIILAIVGAGFFCEETVWAVDHLVINEIQIYPVEKRFIELYNPNDFSVSLTGWAVKKKTSGGKEEPLVASSRLKDKFILSKSYLLLTNKEGYTGNVAADITWAKSYGFAKDNTIILYDNTQAVVDKVGFGLSTDCEGGQVYCALNPDANYSIERKAFVDTNNNNVDFFIQSNPNPQNSTTQTSPQPSPSQGEGENTTTTTPLNPPLSGGTDKAEQKNNFGDVLINEFVSDPADGEVEWIELYNKTGEAIDLTGWRIEDGSKAKTKLAGVIAAAGFKVVEKPAGNLNNGGDLVVLSDSGGKIIDQVAYGNWADGDLSNNAPVARDPASLARLFDGYNSYNNANDFAVTVKPTKGLSNIILAEAEVSLEAKAKFDFSEDIFITEILPNPFGSDTAGEFIELYNAGRREVDLTGWSLSNKDNKKVNLEKIATSTIIKAGEYLAFFRPRTKIVLHNDQGEVKLFQPLAEKPLVAVDYKNVKEGWSYNLTPLNPPLSGGNIKGEWEWSETLTPGAMNVLKLVNHAPEVEFSFISPAQINMPVVFDGSDTADQDDDKLIYAWDFGDGFKNNLANPEHTYLKAGIYKVKLAVSDGKETGEKVKSVKVVGSVGEIVAGETSPQPSPWQGEGVIINEIYPNPEGADTGREWLELLNQSAGRINLLNWRVENENGKFKFKNDLWLEAGKFYLLGNAASQLAFKNSSDTVSLYDNSGELADAAEYIDAVQGESYARGANDKWFWTAKLTPGEENIIRVAASQERIMNNESRIMGNASAYNEATLEEVRSMEIGSLVKVKGTVAVEPGILGAQIFYIVGSPGIQVYNYKKDFPALRVGDYVEISGELSQIQGELRLKTKDKADIKIVEHKPPPPALALSCDQVNEDGVGQLITVSGEITDRKSSTLYLDDGNDEILIYIKSNTGIDTKNLAAGQTAEITGILSKTASGLRLLPRSQADIRLTNFSHGLRPQVLGEVAEGDEWAVAERDKKMELFKYLLIAAGGGIMVLAILLFRARKKG